MLRLIARFIGIWLVAAALVAGVVDGAKSIAASEIVLTPFGETWATLTALTGRGAEAGATMALPWPANIALAWLLSAPTLVVLAVGGFLFLAAGRRRRRLLVGREFAS